MKLKKCIKFLIAWYLISFYATVISADDLSLSLKGGYFHYAEPDVSISYSGLMTGVEGDYQKAFANFTVKLRSEFMTGKIAYDGRLNTQQIVGASVQMSDADGASIRYDADLWYSDSAVLLGKSFSKRNYAITPFTGLGYRFLNNPENSDIPYDYSRQVSYLYLPLVLELRTCKSDKTAWGLAGEVDILLRGSARADMSDASSNYNNLQFDQSLGGAIKLAGFYNRRIFGLDVSVKPFIDVWLVDNSDTDVLRYDGMRVLVKSADGSFGDYCEPANITMTAGLQFNIQF